jgi:hypothetical protein
VALLEGAARAAAISPPDCWPLDALIRKAAVKVAAPPKQAIVLVRLTFIAGMAVSPRALGLEIRQHCVRVDRHDGEYQMGEV